MPSKGWLSDGCYFILYKKEHKNTVKCCMFNDSYLIIFLLQSSAYKTSFSVDKIIYFSIDYIIEKNVLILKLKTS